MDKFEKRDVFHFIEVMTFLSYTYIDILYQLLWFLQGVKIQERVYSADKPPPDRLLRGQYSIGRLLKHAAR